MRTSPAVVRWPAAGWALAGALLAACGARSQPLLEAPPAESATTGGGGAPAGAGVGATGSVGGGSPCDEDADGFDSGACGGADCDDANPALHPGAADFNVTKGPWVVTRVMENVPQDPRGKPGLALDATGAVHVVYAEMGLRYATNRGGPWTSELVDPAASGPCSIALGSDGVVHVSYAVPAEGVRYAKGGSGGWELASVDTGALGPSSIVLDDSGRPLVLYDALAGAVLVTLGDGGWSSAFLLSGSVDASALARGTDGRIHGAVATESGLQYFSGPGPDGGWTTQLVDPVGSVIFTSVAVADSGAAHVAYSLAQGGALGLRHATNEGGPWTTELVADAVVWSASLSVSPVPPELHVAYEESGIHYATGTLGDWAFSTVAPSGAGAALALAPDGSAHIAHSGFDFGVQTYVDYLTDRLVAPDGVDQNCDGVDGVDGDQDGYAATATGGGDCDDQSALTHPGAPDVAGDGVDQDCSGADGAG